MALKADGAIGKGVPLQQDAFPRTDGSKELGGTNEDRAAIVGMTCDGVHNLVKQQRTRDD